MINTNDLEYIQSLDEIEFCELVIIPLLSSMNYKEIRYIHGNLEYGKDIVFKSFDPIEGGKNLCATVKSKELNGTVSSSQSIREIYYQIKQAITEPYISTIDGLEIKIDQVYLITPYVISQNCIRSIKEELKLLENRIYFIDGSKILDLITEYIPNLLSSLDPHARYLSTIARRFQENKTLHKLGNSKQFKFLDLYIDGKLSDISSEDINYISFVTPVLEESNITLASIYKDQPFQVILADVGTGKTSLLQKLFMDIIGFNNNQIVVNSTIFPIFIPLAFLPKNSFNNFNSFLNAIEEYIINYEHYSEFKIQDNNYILLLDGFDEIGVYPSEISKYFQKLCFYFPKGIIITSRPSLFPKLEEPYKYFRLNPFTDDDIYKFLIKWCMNDTKFVDEFLIRINSNKTLKNFCRNPLLLTIYTILTTRYSIDRLPSQRNDIYDSIVRLLIGEWDIYREVKNNFSMELKQYVLEKLAILLQENHSKYFSKYTFTQIIEKVVESSTVKFNPDNLFDEILYRSSLIKSNVIEQYEFVHMSFQEFFCAKYILKNSNVQRIQNLLYNDWWKNVLLFYFSFKNTMDDITIPTRTKKIKGKGFRFVEFLSVASYTSTSKKNSVIELLISDLIYSRNISKNNLDILHNLDENIISVINTNIQSNLNKYSDFHGLSSFEMNGTNFANYIIIQNLFETTGSNYLKTDVVFKICDKLGLEEIVVLLSDLVPYLQKKINYSCYDTIIKSLSNKLSINTNIAHHNYVRSSLSILIDNLNNIINELNKHLENYLLKKKYKIDVVEIIRDNINKHESILNKILELKKQIELNQYLFQKHR